MAGAPARARPAHAGGGALITDEEPSTGRLGHWPAAIAFAVATVIIAWGIFAEPNKPVMPVPTVATPQVSGLGEGCNGPGGRAALAKLVAQIEPDARGVTVSVVNLALVNAAALPAGQIVLFRGLLQEAQSPDEIAGVIAHEIGHIRKGHVRDQIARQMSLGLGFGSVSGRDANLLIATRYSRAAETEADAYSIRALRNGQVSPDGMAGFFDRMAAQDKKRKTEADHPYFQTHPLSEHRERAFRASRRSGVQYRPLLSRDEWDALVDICHNDRALRKQ